MKILSNKFNVDFEDTLFLQLSVEKNGLAIPSKGKNIGINSEPNQYYKNILREDEIRHIKIE